LKIFHFHRENVAGPMEESETGEEVGLATHDVQGTLCVKGVNLQGAPSSTWACGGVRGVRPPIYETNHVTTPRQKGVRWGSHN